MNGPRLSSVDERSPSMKRLESSLRPSRAALATKRYQPLRHSAPIDLKLDSNEGAPPSQDSLLTSPDLSVNMLNRYPNSQALTASLAHHYGVSVNQVLVTAGADEALDRACRALLDPGRSAIYPRPSFEMIPRFVAWAGGTLIEVEWAQPRFPLSEVIEQVTEDTALIMVVSPNNPTGAVVTRDELWTLSAAAPQALILLDHAYVEFVDSPEFDLTSLAMSLPNVCVFRTFSKAWGVAGLRVGYVLGPEPVIDWLTRVGNPYSVSAPSLHLALQRFTQSAPELQRSVEAVRAERLEIRELLIHLGVDAPPSQGNFIFAQTPRALWIRDALAGLGIGIRAWPDHPTLHESLRITCPSDPTACARLSRALSTAILPEALLFDLDGVIAEVSESYRASIIETCATYQVAITLQDISDVKAEGDANNDWVVTQRLLARRGVTASLSEVTERFERIYQGDSTRKGLSQRETMIPEDRLLADLCARFPAAIVTGRPRSDALEFLKRFNLTRHFRVIVTMEDAALKPNPAPVLLALKRLGVQRAWMIGDTVDDVRAARSAEVVPLGVLIPDDTTPDRTRDSLERAGAARVLSHLKDLLELLP